MGQLFKDRADKLIGLLETRKTAPKIKMYDTAVVIIFKKRFLKDKVEIALLLEDTTQEAVKVLNLWIAGYPTVNLPRRCKAKQKQLEFATFLVGLFKIGLENKILRQGHRMLKNDASYSGLVVLSCCLHTATDC